MIFFHDLSRIKTESNKKLMFLSFSENFGFLMKGKVVNTVLNPFCDASIEKPTIMYQHRVGYPECGSRHQSPSAPVPRDRVLVSSWLPWVWWTALVTSCPRPTWLLFHCLGAEFWSRVGFPACGGRRQSPIPLSRSTAIPLNRGPLTTSNYRAESHPNQINEDDCVKKLGKEGLGEGRRRNRDE
jgi:hypothetical protein